MQALASGHKPLIAHAALTYVYYWYNFMPLARGTAVTGYITLLAIFLAADMPITSFIPKVCNCLCLGSQDWRWPFVSLGVQQFHASSCPHYTVCASAPGHATVQASCQQRDKTTRAMLFLQGLKMAAS